MGGISSKRKKGDNRATNSQSTVSTSTAPKNYPDCENLCFLFLLEVTRKWNQNLNLDIVKLLFQYLPFKKSTLSLSMVLAMGCSKKLRKQAWELLHAIHASETEGFEAKIVPGWNVLMTRRRPSYYDLHEDAEGADHDFDYRDRGVCFDG